MKTLCLTFALLMLFVSISMAEIDELDAWADAATEPTFTVSAGTDRMVIVSIAYEVNNGSDIATCSLGTGEFINVRRVSQPISGGGVWNHVEVWRLMDVEIPSGSNTIALTFVGLTPPRVGVGYVTYDSVDQTSPVSDSDTTRSNSTQTLNLTVSTVAGGAAVFATCQARAGTSTWTGPTEQFDQLPGSDFTHSGADDLHASGGSLNGSVTVTGSNGRMVLAGIEFAPSGVAPPAAPPGRRRKLMMED